MTCPKPRWLNVAAALMLALAAPKAVFVVIACEVTALELNCAALAHSLCCLFAKFTCLRAFCRGGEKQVGEALAGAVIHPRVVGQLSRDEIHQIHVVPPNRLVWSRVAPVTDTRRCVVSAPRAIIERRLRGQHRTVQYREGWCPTLSSTGSGRWNDPSPKRNTSRAGEWPRRSRAWERRS